MTDPLRDTDPMRDDDTSAGRITQGGSRDSTSSGPHRRSGNSFWWFAVALLVVVVILVVWLTGAPRKDAPAERNTTPVSGRLAPGGACGPACPPGRFTA